MSRAKLSCTEFQPEFKSLANSFCKIYMKWLFPTVLRLVSFLEHCFIILYIMISLY
uniref:Uncharacterized protein n=1 Tax=Anguilla anguilla TaxID=7936 RepID=A0A0E9WW08_ANGAN